MKGDKLEATWAMWIMFTVYILLVFILGVADLQLSNRLDTQRRELELQQAILTLQGMQMGACFQDMQAWHRWLEIRADGHGTAWFLRPREEKAE